MGRRKGFIGLIDAMARDAARQARQAEAEKKRLEREYKRLQKERARSVALSTKEAKQRYLLSRENEVEIMNDTLNDYIDELKKILTHTLSKDDTISFKSLRLSTKYRSFKPPTNLAKSLNPPVLEDYLSKVVAPDFLAKLLPGAEKRYKQSLKAAEAQYKVALNKYEQEESERKRQLAKLEEEYEKSKQEYLIKAEERNQEVDELEALYLAHDKDTVVTYNSMVLERSEYPDGFPQNFRLTYDPESKQLLIEYELPPKEVIPTEQEYKYVKSKDSISDKKRKNNEIAELYQDMIAAVTLRTIHEVFEADQCNSLLLVVFNGYISAVDPATGKDIVRYVVSVRVTKDAFLDLNLEKLDKLVCLRNLGAQVSPRPAELLAVKPIVEFNMVDKRFVEESDILSSLDARPNLMDLNPFEFENLVSNLFGRMGLETKLTRSSKDGGVDAVAFDTRPVIGGKVVIQAKRYKNVVGVSAVRDLYGTMMNEGANKGILVTTSNYGPDAYEFSKDKPIELIDGGGLLYLLEQNGTRARIIFSD